jgi:hypothetical protein
MSFYYAQVNEENICVAVSELAGDMSKYSNLLRIESFDSSLLGKKWNGTDWEEVPQPEPLSSTPEEETT